MFDSGMGGLTVLAALRKALPDERFLYLGDTARLPYGTKTVETVQRYAAKAASHLVDRGVKALVVACNTASASALKTLRTAFAPLPVYGVVEPGADAAAAAADDSGVLVLATESTIQGGAYQRALTARNARMPVYGRACPLWVTMAEQGPQNASFTRTVLQHDLRGLVPGGPATLLLGCTHFPVFTNQLRDLVGADVRVVDSAQTTATYVAEQLASEGLLGAPGGETLYLATDGANRFVQVGRHFLGEEIQQVEVVDL